MVGDQVDHAPRERELDVDRGMPTDEARHDRREDRRREVDGRGMMTGIVNGCFQMVEIPDPKFGPRTVDLPSMYNTDRYRPIYSGKAGFPVFLARAK